MLNLKPKYKMKKINLFALMLLFSMLSYSQSFMPAFSNPGGKTNEGMVIKQDGDTIKGKFLLIFHVENIKKLTIKDESGVKHKLETEQINKVLIKVRDLAKFAAFDNASSIKDLGQTDFNKIGKTDYYIYERAVTPKKGKIKVMQLVNFGFSTKMKVYRNPTSGETGGIKLGGIKLTGGIEKSYYIVKSGEETAIEVKKGKYKKQFYEIFTVDCPKMKDVLDGKKPDWDDFPLHVFIHNQTCE